MTEYPNDKQANLYWRLSGLWHNNYVRMHHYGPYPYKSRCLVICLWWNDDYYKYFYLFGKDDAE
jgi:hypothetical protein